MSQTERKERRCSERMSLNMPVIVSGTNSAGQTFYEVTSSINLSSSGIYFPLNQFLDRDTELQVWIVQITNGINTRFGAKARVVRQDAASRRELSGATFPVVNMAVQFLENLDQISAA